MALLLYKSNEMFSSTELIRKSKMIFDKILGKKIEKAIILRDGKPSFLLMEFSKYEKIMAEYEKLKEYVEQTKDDTASKKIVQSYKVKEKNNKEKTKKAEKNQSENRVEDLSEKEEIVQAYSSIDSMDIDDEKKIKAKEKIKAKILEARKEREKIALEDPEQKIIEQELEDKIAAEKLKKEQELEEFWD